MLKSHYYEQKKNIGKELATILGGNQLAANIPRASDFSLLRELIKVFLTLYREDQILTATFYTYANTWGKTGYKSRILSKVAQSPNSCSKGNYMELSW